MAANAPRFDVGTLRELAGEKVFARGVEYYEDERVEIITIDKTRVLAQVAGSEVYRTQLQGHRKDVSGECSCPAYTDWGFCKHLVATALATNALEPKALEAAAGRFRRIGDYLRSKNIDELVGLIIGHCERDPALLDELELGAVEAAADNTTLFARFKTILTNTTRTGAFIDYHRAREWAGEIDQVLDRIEGLIDRGRADVVLQLLNYFFARMDEALQNMDDSDGCGGGVYARGCEIHLSACRKAKPDPIALARDLFRREVETEFDFFHGASNSYADILGEAGLAEYRRLAVEAWQAIKPPRQAKGHGEDEQFGDRYRLSSILDAFAKRVGDLDGRIALRVEDLSSAYSYLELAQLCLDHKREAEALKWAEEGLWRFEDAPDQRLVQFASDLYVRMGRREDATTLLWRSFERVPSMELYRRLKASAGVDTATANLVRDRALAWLRSRIGKPDARARWSAPIELFLQILMAEKMLTEAWEVVQVHGCHDSRLESLAKASENEHPKNALAAYARLVDRQVSMGGRPNYQNACAMIARMQAIRERTGGSSDHAAYLADLKIRHKAKRNFMKLMEAGVHLDRRHGHRAATKSSDSARENP